MHVGFSIDKHSCISLRMLALLELAQQKCEYDERNAGGKKATKEIGNGRDQLVGKD